MAQNGGPAAARNRGAREALGEWLAFLDADDLWLPWRLEVQCGMAARHPDVPLWCGDTIDLVCALPEKPVSAARELHRLTLDDFLVTNPVATSTVMLRRATFLSMGGFDEQFRGPEDYDLWMRVAAGGQVGRLACPLSRYRSDPGSLSMDDRKFLPQVLRVLAKAFSRGGVFHDRPQLYDTAACAQYWSASWMAFQRRDRATALRHWCRAYVLNRRATVRGSYKWVPLLWRYLAGSYEA
jgi:glycosyltransferase involved in cell wall biosynthesis